MEENYIVSARKYRPSTFSSVVGQKALTATLRNAIATNRLAHAYLFCGSRGVGKTSCARIFAKTINCEHPTPEGDPCNECSSCRQFNENRSLNILELDAASNNSVNDIRELTDQVLVPPTEGRYRVFIIDEVHMLSQAAFNAFLKTLEEPPAHVIFILATTEKHKIIPTILSRCQIYDFSRITIADMVEHLQYVASKEGIEAERQALTVIARKADGAMRDALSIFDQVAASSRGKITYQSAIDNLNVLDERYFSSLVEAFRKCDIPGALTVYKEVRDHGFDSHFFINGIAQYLRDLMVARDPRTLPLLDADETIQTQLRDQAKDLPPEFFYAAMSLCNEADLNYRQASNKTFLVELLLIRLCQQAGPSPGFSGNGEGREIKPIQPAAQNTATAEPATALPPKAPHTPSPAPASTPYATPAPPAGHAQAAPRPVSRTAGKRHISMGSAFEEKTTAQTSAPRGEATRNREPFTPDRVAELWNSHKNDDPKAHVLINTMRAHKPVPAGDANCPERYTVTVVNPGQVDLLNAEKPRLLEAMRKELGNDFFDFDVLMNAAASTPASWSDRKLLEVTVESSPQLAQLIHDLKLKL